MRRPRLGTAAIAVALAATGCGGAPVGHRSAPASAQPARPAPGQVETVWFHSPALRQRRRMLVFLPPGYRAAARRGQRFGVLYLLHAPPGDPVRLFVRALRLGAVLDRLIARHAIAPMLVVAPLGKTRLFGSDTEWANARAGPYMSFVLDAVRAVDERFATYRDRQHRGIGGLSAGGYGALNVALHHLGVFSVVECWSGYFDQQPTAAFTGARAAELRANSPAAYVPSLAPPIRRLGLRAWIYQGLTEFINPRHLIAFAPELHAAGADVHYAWFEGIHGLGLWRRQLPRMLEAASAWFAQPPSVAARHPGLVEIGPKPLPHAVWHEIVFHRARICAERRLPAGLDRATYCRRFMRRHARRRSGAAGSRG